ncbi:hypothetical protein CYMTET_39601 [Cymbomonas tetramitiformis]|uniref:Uncharacterized protein n=1 Tax=Cymbomonas tetramitiformis TaxID=36881 RepID=A0AAE0C9T6_9CHLO|nr:hypothetical protein CYMTET_39601 [Cymbomonas tetramitiformis]
MEREFNVAVCAQEKTIARDIEGISDLGIYSRGRLMVYAQIADGKTKDVTMDSQTRYAVLKGSDIVDIQKNRTHVTVRAPDDRVGHGHATIQIDHTSPYTRLTEYVTISVVEKTAFVVTSHAYPSQFDDDPLEKTVVRKVHCTNVYQRLRLRSRVYMSDETAYEVTDESVFSTSTDIRVKRGPNEVILVAKRRGRYSVSATWKGLVSRENKIVVSDELARVKTIQHTTNWITSRSGQTFYGVAKSRQALSLKVHFDDGTTFVDAVNGVQSKWLGYEQYVTFSSDRNESVEVNGDGVAILLENHHSEVAIEARTVCDTPDVETIKNITLVFANLKAATNDVDLGKNDGAQFAPVVVGETFSVPVLVQAGDARLKLYDVRLSITNEYTLRVADCKIGDDWTNMTFSCTINDPVVEVMIVGSEPNSTATGLVHVATVTFEAWNTSVNSARISGNVYAIGTTNFDTDINANESTAPTIVAGNGEVLFRLSGDVKSDDDTHAFAANRLPYERADRDIHEVSGDVKSNDDIHAFAADRFPYELEPTATSKSPATSVGLDDTPRSRHTTVFSTRADRDINRSLR